MAKFYFLLWLRWAARVVTCSVLLAYLISIIITAFIYFSGPMPTINAEVFSALRDVLEFWYPIVFSFTLLFALFRSMKYIFNSCAGGYELKLLTCRDSEIIQSIGYGDLVKVWRRWIMLNIWLVGFFMIVALIFTYIFTDYEAVFDWFSIYWLFAFILASAYVSFILLSTRCKQVRIKRC
jgi:hypothetical protein